MVIPGPTAQNFPVGNLGTTYNLTLSNPQITGTGAAAYSVTSMPGPISPSGSGALQVTFNPAAPGNFLAQLSLDTNDPFSPTVTVTLVGQVAGSGTPILQWGFDSTSGAVSVPITDDSGAGHPATNMLGNGAATYSDDIPSAAKTQHVTGIGSVNLATDSTAGIATPEYTPPATPAEIWAAGGLTMEVWVKNPVQAGQYTGFALSFGDMFVLGISGDRIGFSTAWGDPIDTNDYAPGEWNHLAAVVVPTTADCGSYNISAYLNGKLIGSGSNTREFLYRAACVGNSKDGNVWNNYNGLVYEPRISLGTLTPDQFTIAINATTATVVTTSGLASTSGDSVTLTATVTPAPTGGTVQFHDNGTDIGTAATVDTGTGVATLATTALTVGSHTITATYSGTTGFLTSADSTGATQTVLSKFEAWAVLKGLTSGNNGPNDDPDADAVPNFIEFAFNGDPKSAADNGMIHVTTEDSTFYGGKVLVLTVAVRSGTPAEWTENTATIDGITYTIEGGTTLDNFNSSGTIVGPFDNNTYAPDISAAGYEWRRFVLTGSVGLGTKGFLRARVVQD